MIKRDYILAFIWGGALGLLFAGTLVVVILALSIFGG